MDVETGALKRNGTTALASASCFVLTLCLFTPARIYVGNFKEFSSLFEETILFFLGVSLVLAAALLAAVLATSRRPRAFRVFVSVLFALALLMWLQGNILPWRYGVLNGKDIAWDELVGYGIIDSVIWIGLLAFAIVGADLVVRVSRLASLALVVVQLLSTVQGWVAMPKDQSFRQQVLESGKPFLFSRHRNVIVMVLDTFQSDIFQEIIQEDAELRLSFDGFTYFRNALAGSDATSVSVPNMLTASNYDNTVPYLQFVRKAFVESSLPKTLREYGFSLEIKPIVPYSVFTDFSGATLATRRLPDWGAISREQAFIADLALFRDSPHFLKPAVYNHQGWLISGLVERRRESRGASEEGAYTLKYAREYRNARGMVGASWDASFIHRMIPASAAADAPDTFKFYHLNGIHLSLIMDENLRRAAMEQTRAGMKRQGTGVLKIAAIFLERLRQLGVFDNSLIFIVGDHGAGLADTGIRPTSYGSTLNRSGPYKGVFENFKSAGIPLVLVKRVGASGTLRTSDAPVSLGDIPQTVVEQLGLRGEFPGKSMFQVEEGESRGRIYRAFVGPQEDVEYFAPLWEYSVNGFSWDDTSWRETGAVYYARSR